MLSRHMYYWKCIQFRKKIKMDISYKTERRTSVLRMSVLPGPQLMESSFDNFVYGNSSLPQSVTSLPAYTRRLSPPSRAHRQLTEHVVELSSDNTNKRAKPWATLRVYSKAPAGSLPTFVEGETITGSVTLNSDMSNSRHVSCVKVIVSFSLVEEKGQEEVSATSDLTEGFRPLCPTVLGLIVGGPFSLTVTKPLGQRRIVFRGS